jgi:hypothetical protein
VVHTNRQDEHSLKTEIVSIIIFNVMVLLLN